MTTVSLAYQNSSLFSVRGGGSTIVDGSLQVEIGESGQDTGVDTVYETVL